MEPVRDTSLKARQRRQDCGPGTMKSWSLPLLLLLLAGRPVAPAPPTCYSRLRALSSELSRDFQSLQAMEPLVSPRWAPGEGAREGRAASRLGVLVRASLTVSVSAPPSAF